MNIAIVTGSAGLIGSQSVRFLADKFDQVVGIDNNMRAYFFGDNASVDWNRRRLEEEIPNYRHLEADIRDFSVMEKINGTINLLEATRLVCPEAVFIFTSTNKVYGDTPNRLPLVELDTRWEISEDHKYYEHGIDEEMSIDHCKHSLFGASKVAADVMAQEYGRYFGMNVGVFRGGCLTGPNHSGTQLHGFLSYLMKCAITGDHYTIFGYKGKQVRDNIHSYDLVNMFWHFYQNPRQGEAYNAGGGRHSNCSMQEANTIPNGTGNTTLKTSWSKFTKKWLVENW